MEQLILHLLKFPQLSIKKTCLVIPSPLPWFLYSLWLCSLFLGLLPKQTVCFNSTYQDVILKGAKRKH